MLVGEIMTRDVVTVGPEATVSDVAALFAEKNISGLPVVDSKQRVLGVVSEADLLHRAENRTVKRHSWWLAMLQSDAAAAGEFVRQRAVRVGDIMETEIVSVPESARIGVAANLLDKHNIKRLVVLRGEKLAGIVTRADIVRVLAKQSAGPVPAAGDVSDEALRDLLGRQIAAEPWARGPHVSTSVHDGVVELNGFVNSDSQKQALRVLAESLPGVKAVRDQLQVFIPPVAPV